MNRTVVWLAGLAVALGAAALTAHGVFEVTVAARVPKGVAWLYPLITDGLALVAYASTAVLSGAALRYAWAVVGLAAGLSGLAQASYLASAAALDPVRALPVPAELRFGVGAWPAIAAALTAHLLYLIAEAKRATATEIAIDQAGAAVGLGSDPAAPADPAPELPVDGPVQGAAPAGTVVDPPQEQHPSHERDENTPTREWTEGEAVAWAVAELREGNGPIGNRKISRHTGLRDSPARRVARRAREEHEQESRPRLVSG